jgi:hypothetical protein
MHKINEKPIHTHIYAGKFRDKNENMRPVSLFKVSFNEMAL